ncbi:hypothetical protein Tco_1247447 [Tanacetum coccineum]
MSTSKFAETHNLVAFLEKPEESNGFDGIIDFLNASSIKYVLTVNPTIYKSCIQQFWATAKAKTVNGERQIQTLVDKKKVIITEKSVRSDLMLEDAEGTECLPNDIFHAAPTDSHSTPIITQPSSSKPKKKKSKRKQRKDNGLTEPVYDVATNEEPTSTPSCDPPQSGKDRLQLAELMTLWLKKIRKVGSASRVASFSDVSLGAQEDASKQGRKIADLDADAEVTLIDETLERFDEEMLFDVQDDLQVTTTSATTIVDELDLAATLLLTRITTVVAAQDQRQWNSISEELDNIQVMIDANEQLAAKLQAEEQEQFLIQEKSRMLVEMIAKRKKFFAAQRAAKQKKKSKRAGDELESDKSKKQKIDKGVGCRSRKKDDQSGGKDERHIVDS